MALLQSRKFWLLILDTIISLAVYFVGKYAGVNGEYLLFIIATLQPVFIALIIGITVEDAAAKLKGTFPFWPR